MVALKEPTTVASQAQRFHVARAEKVSPELAQVAQEFLATEHWLFELSAQTHRDWRSQTAECCWTCHVNASTMARRGPYTHPQRLGNHDSGGTGGARRASSIGPSGNCSDAVACRT